MPTGEQHRVSVQALGHVFGFAGQRGLVHPQVIALDDDGIGWDQITVLHASNVADDQLEAEEGDNMNREGEIDIFNWRVEPRRRARPPLRRRESPRTCGLSRFWLEGLTTKNCKEQEMSRECVVQI
jgi:hypothetical protein